LPFLVFFMHTIFERFTRHYHWALKLLFLTFLFLLFIVNIKINRFIHVSVVTVLKVRHIHFLGSYLWLIICWMLLIWLQLIICFLHFKFNISIISRIIRHWLNRSLLRVVDICDGLHLIFVLDWLYFFRGSNWDWCSFGMCWYWFWLINLTVILLFTLNLFLFYLMILISLSLRIKSAVIYLF